MTDPFHEATAVADAVLYEGYLLYPYRASSGKNRIRFQFGVLVPPGAAAAAAEHATSMTECLCEPGPGDRLTVRLRFLQHRARRVEAEAGGGTFREVDRLRIAPAGPGGDEREVIGWDEAVERAVEVAMPMPDDESVLRFSMPASVDVEPVAGGRIVRTCQALTGEIRCRARRLDGPYGGTRLSVVIANTTRSAALTRDEALPYALIGAHALIGLDGGRFLSLADPPEWAMPAAAECVNEHSWPVLVNDRVVLASPIILDDHPKIAPESPGALFDGTEIDELLTLRTMTLTDAEKQEVRATDERARELLDRIESMPPELLDRLHGTIRYLRDAIGPADPATGGALDAALAAGGDPAAVGPATAGSAAGPAAISPAPDGSAGLAWPDQAPGGFVAGTPEEETVMIRGVRVAKGSRVRLTPRPVGTDAQDMFLHGKSATVAEILSDVDGRQYVAVAVDDDPAAAIGISYGRFRYFDPDEVVPIGSVPAHLATPGEGTTA